MPRAAALAGDRWPKAAAFAPQKPPRRRTKLTCAFNYGHVTLIHPRPKAGAPPE